MPLIKIPLSFLTEVHVHSETWERSVYPISVSLHGVICTTSWFHPCSSDTYNVVLFLRIITNHHYNVLWKKHLRLCVDNRCIQKESLLPSCRISMLYGLWWRSLHLLILVLCIINTICDWIDIWIRGIVAAILPAYTVLWLTCTP